MNDLYAIDNTDPRLIVVSTNDDNWTLELEKPWSLVGYSINALLLQNGGKLVVQFADAKKDYVVTAQPTVQRNIEDRFDLFNISDKRILCYARWHEKYALYDRASKRSVMIKGASLRMSERGDLWSIGKPECSCAMPLHPHQLTIPAKYKVDLWYVWQGHAVLVCNDRQNGELPNLLMIKDAHDRIIHQIELKERPVRVVACQHGVMLSYWNYMMYLQDNYNWALKKTGTDRYIGANIPFLSSVIDDDVYKRLTKVSHRRTGFWK